MKRLILLFISIMCLSFSYCQKYDTKKNVEFVGVKLGMSMNSCKKILDYKLDSKGVLTDNYSLGYKNVFFGDRLIDDISLYFKRGKLNTMILSIYVGDRHEALNDSLIEEYKIILSKKYGLKKSKINDYGPSYEFGKNPYLKNTSLINLFFDINIDTNEKELVIGYGPYFDEKLENLF